MNTLTRTLCSALVVGAAALSLISTPVSRAQDAAKAEAADEPQAAKQADQTSSKITEMKLADNVLRWEGDITPMPMGITSFGAVVAGDWLYIAGGNRLSAHEYSEAGLNHDFMRLNLNDRSTWQKLPGSFPRLSLALVEHDGLLYRVGGAQVHQVGEGTEPYSTDEFSVFNPADMSWSDLPAMPHARSSHDACVLNGVLYVAGGWNMQADGRTWSEELWSFDLSKGAEGEWQSIPQPFTIRAAGLAAAQGKLWLTGGITSEGQFSRALHVYDVESGEWSSGPEFPGDAFGATIAVPAGRPTLSAMDGQVYHLSSDGSAWQSLGKLFRARYFHRVVTISDDEIAVVSGATPGGRANFIEWMSSDARENRNRHAHLVLENPGPAKNRQGAFVLDGELFLAGGNDGLEQHDFGPERFQDAARKVNLVTFETTELEDFPVNRQSMVTAICTPEAFLGAEYWSEMSPREKRMAKPEPLLIGGFGHNGETAFTQDGVFHYDVLLERWKQVGTLPNGLTQFGTTEHDGKLFVFGGMDFDRRRGSENMFSLKDTILSAQLGGTELSFTHHETKLPRPRRAFSSVKHDGKMYLIGGMAGGFSPVGPCDVYDFEADEWSVIPSPARVRISADLIPFEGKLYLLGGSSFEEGEALPESAIEVFDPAANEWRELPGILPIDPNHLRATVDGNSILLTSTQNDDGELHVIWMQAK